MLRLLLLITMPFILDAVVAYALAATPDDRPVQASMIFFDWDQADLSLHARTTLAEASSAAATGRTTRIILQAADGVGRATAYGTALSNARWRNVLAELAQDGASADQIVRSGVGTVVLRPRGAAVNMLSGWLPDEALIAPGKTSHRAERPLREPAAVE